MIDWPGYCRNCFQVACAAWGIQPSEFWRMSPDEWFWIYDVRRPDRDHVRLRYDRELLDLIGAD